MFFPANKNLKTNSIHRLEAKRKFQPLVYWCITCHRVMGQQMTWLRDHSRCQIN